MLTYIEIDIPFCANTYGVAPCMASLTDSPPTGTRKCFNTPNTCQDRVNYIDAPVTLRFSEDVGFLPQDINVIPTIVSMSFTPAEVSLGKNLGTRASLSVTFKDHPWPDTGEGFDKYLSERPYNPYTQGTFWGKFRARQPFLRGRAMRLIRGEVGQALSEMETRHFIIDSYSQKAEDGTTTILAKDVLKLADDDRSQAPALSSGFLNADITAVATQMTLSPSGVGDEYTEDQGYLAIGGKEIVHYEHDLLEGNDAFTKLLIQFDGALASTSFTDASSSAKTVTTNGNTFTDGGGAFGNCARFDGSGDYLSLADSADWTFGSADFTIDFWAWWNTLAATQTLFTHFTDSNNRYFLSVSSAGALTFSVISASSTIVTMTSANGVVSTGSPWRHIAVVRYGNVWTIYVQGVQVATTTDSDAVPNFTSQFRIGVNNSAAQGYDGWIDEFRVSTGIARWTADFTPPGGRYQQSAELFTISRAKLSTTAIAHEAGDRAQVVLRYVSQDAADIIRDLLVNYAGVDDSLIPIETWQNETANFLNRLFSANIAEPVGVNKLLSELIEDAALSLWWDDVTPQIRLRVLRAIATDAFLFDQDTYLEGSFSSRDQPNDRVSEVWRYFAKRNSLEPQDNSDNYRSVAVTVDLQAETDYGSSVIKKIFSRWIPFGGRSIADTANELYLARFRDPPRRFNFSVFKNGTVTPELGQGYLIGALGLQDDTGADVTAPIQITRLNPGDTQFDIEAQELLISGDATDLTNRVIVIDSDTSNVNLKTLHDTLYPAATAQDVIDGVTLKCYVEEGVIVSASGSRAFQVGSGWPTGFSITLIVNGRIAGKGGKGGNMSTVSSSRNGVAGGTALYTRFPIVLEYTGGIWGGGGGGGAGAARYTGDTTYCGGGGGGGAGDDPGAGGIGGICDGNKAPDGDPGTATLGGDGGNSGNDGGHGGTPGAAGTNGQDNNGLIQLIDNGDGGAGGSSIDGISFITVTVSTGTLLGSQVN